jgi:putative redox protein
MTLHKVDTRWLDGMAFENLLDGHRFTVDAAAEFGGKDRGPRPKPLMLNALAGCTGMDVVSVLNKMKQPLSWFNIRVEGDLSDEHPKTYKAIRLTYQFKKSDKLDDAKVIKAVNLSQEQYCGVSAMLKKVCELTWNIEYLD